MSEEWSELTHFLLTTRSTAAMANEDLTKEALLKLSIGHLLVVWDVLANRLTGTPFVNGLSDEEKRAMWALEDLCERGIVANGVLPRPKPEWDKLMQAAKLHVQSIPVEFLD